MTRKEQHKKRKRENKGSYRELFFGTIYLNPLNTFVFKWQLIEVESD